MTVPNITTDQTRGREIISECPRCRLPIYTTDDRDWLQLPNESHPTLYHAGCAYRREVAYWQEQAEISVRKLRALHCVVRFEIQVPVS